MSKQPNATSNADPILQFHDELVIMENLSPKSDILPHLASCRGGFVYFIAIGCPLDLELLAVAPASLGHIRRHQLRPDLYPVFREGAA